MVQHHLLSTFLDLLCFASKFTSDETAPTLNVRILLGSLLIRKTPQNVNPLVILLGKQESAASSPGSRQLGSLGFRQFVPLEFFVRREFCL